MKVEFKQDRAIITGEKITPSVVFNCGQAFRFHPAGPAMRGVAHGRVLHAEETARGLELYPVTPADFSSIWRRYFDLDLPYSQVEACFSGDPVMQAALPCCAGLRLLVQEPFETLISFIISANNNIPRIKGLIERICMEQGEALGDGLFAFPTPGQLARISAQRFRELGAGYRADYLADTARAVADGAFDLDAPYALPYEEAKKLLTALKGVGPKVADCILLFAYGKREAFPRDVWIKRVLKELYGFVPKNDDELLRFARERFGPYGGIAQQYLFHYARQSKLENIRKL